MEKLTGATSIEDKTIWEGIAVHLLNGQGHFVVPHTPELSTQLRPLLTRGNNRLHLEDGRSARFFIVQIPTSAKSPATIEFFIYGWD